MNPRELKNNQDLFNYLARLSSELRTKGMVPLADEVELANRFSIGSPSEFLHEAQIILVKILNESSGLNPEEIDDIKSVISQIKFSFQKVGGA